VGGQDLEIDKDHIIQYAHYGYVYCMLLAKGLSDDADVETLISGGGEGTIKLWSLGGDGDDGPKKPVAVENGDDSVLALALDGTVLYAGRLEGAVDIWDLDTRQLIRTVKAHTADTLTLAAGHGLIFSGAAHGFAKVTHLVDLYSMNIFTNRRQDSQLAAREHQQMEGTRSAYPSFLRHFISRQRDVRHWWK